MKRPNLADQIAAVASQAMVCRNSYTHRSGKWKGRIPPGFDRHEVESLEAAVKTLWSLLPKKKS